MLASQLGIITARKRSCGKVIFSQASVSHSVHRRVSGSVHAGIHPTPRADTPSTGSTPPPGTTHPPWKAHTPEAHPSSGAHTPAADGTHPTGMLSCLCLLSNYLSRNTQSW